MTYSLSEFNPSIYFKKFDNSNHIVIAYSGGIDSSVLLNIMCANKEHLKQSIEVIHVNHGLHEKSSNWEDFCKKECEKYKVTFKSIKIQEDCPKENSVEAWARNMRYKLISKHVKKNDILITAHHKDDQVETFFLQLLRGSGVHGLASMPVIKEFKNGFHVRPFLSFQRNEITKYAKENNISWIDDETNLDINYQRNFLRHNVLPTIDANWLSYRESILRVISHQADSMKIHNEIAQLDMEKISCNDTSNLHVGLIKELSEERKKNLIFFWLKNLNLETPSSKHMKQIISALINSDQQKSPCVNWGNTEVRRYKKFLYASNIVDNHESDIEITWDINSPLMIEGETLTTIESQGKGLSKECIKDANIIIRYRHGGEKIYTNSLSQSKSIKQLFQERSVLPWLRNKIPLIYINDELAVVPGFCVGRKFSADKNESSLDILWSGYNKVIQN